MRRLQQFAYPVTAALLALGLWYGLAAGLGVPGYLLPQPHEVARAFGDEFLTLLRGLTTTGAAALAGLALSATLGLGMALPLGASRVLRQALYPHVLLLQIVPVVILTPLLVLWLGPGFPSVTAVTFLITFFPVVSNTTQGLLATPQVLLDLFRTRKASKTQEMFLLRLPYSLPHYFDGLRIAATLAPVGAIAGEFFAGSGSGGRGGLGYLVIVYFSRHETAALFATGFTACLLGFLFVGAVSIAARLSLRHWYESYRADSQ